MAPRLHKPWLVFMSKKPFIITLINSPWLTPFVINLQKYFNVVKIDLKATAFPKAFIKQNTDARNKHTLQEWKYPPGFNGKLSIFFRKKIEKRLLRLIEDIYHINEEWPYILTDYPKFHKYLKKSHPFKIIYFNQDSNDLLSSPGVYSQLKEEKIIIKKADIVICASFFQMQCFKIRFPDKADLIFHLPHGISEKHINDKLDHDIIPNSVAVVGRLTGRYDWELIEYVHRPSLLFDITI